MKIVLQSESGECGLACLAMISEHYGRAEDLVELRRRFSTSLKGATLEQLVNNASATGLASRPLRLELSELDKLSLPAILHWNLNHFVVLERIKRTLGGEPLLVIYDPAVGVLTIPLQTASKSFTGVALELTPAAGFEMKTAGPSFSIRQLTGKIVGLRRAVGQVLILAFTLELFAIATPLFNQYIIDEVLPGGDIELLNTLLLGFLLLTVTQYCIALARNWFMMRWGLDINFQLNTRLLSHLVRLPPAYFEKRHLGDILSRFGSVNPIQTTLTRVLTEHVLDAVIVVFSLAMMLMYSAFLAVIVVVALLLYIFLRWIFYQPFREASLEAMVLSAKEGTHFLETVRAIVPIKQFCRVDARIARWQNMRMDVQNRSVKTEKLSNIFRSTNSLIFGVAGLLMFYFGAKMIMAETFTVGMLTAFTSYSATFSARVTVLIDAFISVKMLSLHVERLSDIVMEKAETEPPVRTDVSRLKPRITLKDVKFRYAEGEPWVLDGVNLEIQAGENMVLVGESGCGKSTLSKLLTGLLEPTEGEVLIDGIPVRHIGYGAYRSLVGSVSQNDTLLAGSIIENISFFDTTTDVNRVYECAKLAAIHEDILAMPMGYQTLVGDMGSSLSGGQKQRVLLARALYMRPIILILDEATSHLDVSNERKVNDALKSLPITRIMVAHRPETIRAADRIVEVGNGKVRYVEGMPGVSGVLAEVV